MSRSDEEQALDDLEKLLEELPYHQLAIYNPKTKQRLFHKLGATIRKRCLMAGNQTGKTYSASRETAYHLTGLYPEWWDGRRFDHPVRFWVCGPDREHVRDNAQKLLFGPPDSPGSGSLPPDTVVQQESLRGVTGALDYALIRHVTGGLSYVKFKSYDQEVEKFSGDTLDGIWFDEEAPWKHYVEGVTRTNLGDNGKTGMAYMTTTPLLGLSETARSFYPRAKDADAATIRMGLRDCELYTDAQITAIASTYKEHERRARVEGKPQLGEGAVFPIDLEEKDVLCDLPERLKWNAYLGAMDFGGVGDRSHPTAAVEGMWERDTDVVTIMREMKQTGTMPENASVIRRWGNLPIAWPHDGWKHDMRSGLRVAELYRQEGLDLLPMHAQYEDKTAGLEASIAEMNDRLTSGRLRIVRSCTGLVEEIEGYRRENGRVVKEYDDLISAVRYLLMMLRYARAGAGGSRRVEVVGLDYDPLEA